MKTNKSNVLKFALTSLVILASIFLVNFASALSIDEITFQAPTSIKHNVGSFTITFNITNSGDAGDTALTLAITKGKATTLIPATIALDADSSKTVTATITLTEAQQSGTIDGTLTVNPTTGNAATKTKTFSVAIDNTAALSITPETQEIKTGNSAKVDIKNEGNVDSVIKLNASGAFIVSFSDNDFAIPAKGTKQITVTTSTNLAELDFGANSVTIIARDNVNNVEDTATITSTKSFCKAGSVGGNLSITRIKIDSNGDKNEVWKPLDVVDIEVTVDNIGKDDINDVFVKLALFDSTGSNQVSDLVFENTDEEEIDVGRIRDSNDESVTFTFKVPADFEDGSYKLAIKAFSDDLGESVECVDKSDEFSDNDLFENIDVEKQDDVGKFIAFDNIEITPTNPSCGDSVTISFDAFNVGEDEQDQIKVNLRSSELNLNLEREIRENLDLGDKASVSFDFIVPNNLQDKLYRLELDSDYDYNNGVYKESSDDSTPVSLNVIGCSGTPTEDVASVSANLDSEAVAGEELIVSVVIKSLLNQEADFVIRLDGYQSWAIINSVSDRLIHLNKGESKEITISFNINDDASGDQDFSLEVIGNGKSTTEDITVSDIQGTESPTFDLGLRGNNLLWIIGIINVILIILIIIVAVRVSRR